MPKKTIKKKTKDGAKEIQMFKPQAKMVKALNAALDPDNEGTITAIFKQINVPRSAWYKWKKKPGFTDWWNEQWRKGMEDAEWYLDKIGLRKAKKGDYAFWQAMQMKYHKFSLKEEKTVKDTTDYSQIPLEKRKKALEILKSGEDEY